MGLQLVFALPVPPRQFLFDPQANTERNPMNPSETPNSDLLETSLKVGPFTVAPITPKSLVALERIGNPYVAVREGPPMPFSEAAEALWVLKNIDRPDLSHIIGNAENLSRNVDALVAGISIEDYGAIMADLKKAFNAVQKVLADSGLIGKPDEKKDQTGPSE